MPSAVYSELPELKAALRLGEKGKEVQGEYLYDVKFYPYTRPGLDPVFAVVGTNDIIVCRPLEARDKGVEVLQWLTDEDKDAKLNSVVWSVDEVTGDPLLCVVGTNPTIKILNVRTGKLVKSIIGHGAAVNDLAMSPLSPHLLASGSEDHSIRIWNISNKYEEHPCFAICAGEGHRAGILTINFHHTGRYLLSGGMDSRVNMWVLPSFPDENADTDNTTLIHYPHFSSTEIHTDFVDCVRFYGDLIISKSATENRILIWKINGFDSRKAIPPRESAPTINTGNSETRSAFSKQGGYQILLTFDSPRTDWFYMRFGLFHQPEMHPILVFGNDRSRIMFWDLQKLENQMVVDDGHEKSEPKKARISKKAPSGGLAASSLRNLKRVPDVGLEASTGSTGSNSAGSAPSDALLVIADPFRPIKPHKVTVIPAITFCSRQATWSTCGEWCVIVGAFGMVCIFHRKLGRTT